MMIMMMIDAAGYSCESLFRATSQHGVYRASAETSNTVQY